MRNTSSIRTVDPARRRLLRWLAAGPAVLALGMREQLAHAGQVLEDEVLAPRTLTLVSTHTGERLAVRYFESGQYLPDALTRLNHVLRDHRSGDVSAIDPRLFDQLHALARCAACAPHYEIISGYRSPATNEKLRQGSSGVASRSLHMDGRAIDVRLKGMSTARVRDLALSLKSGGVGYYQKSDFVHLDTGRVRSWAG
jgi:uncharacterized protein YcbK (DUF882 family)